MKRRQMDGFQKKKRMDANTSVIQACVNAAALLKKRHSLFFFNVRYTKTEIA